MAEEQKDVTAPAETKPEIKADVKAPAEAAGKTTDTTAKAAAPAKEAPATEKTEDGKSAEELKSLLDEAGEEVKDKDGAAVKIAPEKYEAFKLPDGISISEEAMKLVDPIFKELALSQEEAQKLVDLQTSIVKQREDAHVAEFEKYKEQQKAETVKFFGPKLKEAMANVARARDQFMAKELVDKLNVSGFSNDKDMMVFLEKIGRIIGEGKFIEGQASGGKDEPGSSADLGKVYPSMTRK